MIPQPTATRKKNKQEDECRLLLHYPFKSIIC